MEKTIPKLLRETALAYPETAAQRSKDKDGNFIPVTYHDVFQFALDFGAGLLSIGVQRGDHIGLISDNRKEWFQADVGLLSIGAIDVPRGNDATYVAEIWQCDEIVLQNCGDFLLNLFCASSRIRGYYDDGRQRHIAYEFHIHSGNEINTENNEDNEHHRNYCRMFDGKTRKVHSPAPFGLAPLLTVSAPVLSAPADVLFAVAASSTFTT